MVLSENSCIKSSTCGVSMAAEHLLNHTFMNLGFIFYGFTQSDNLNGPALNERYTFRVE